MQTTEQFPGFEPGLLVEKYLKLRRGQKIYFWLYYCFFLAYFSLPGLSVPFLEYSEMKHSSLMDQRILEHAFFYYPSQGSVSIDDVNPALLKGILCMEDDGFFEHKGVNWGELEKSIRLNQKRKKASRGGSTVTMQLAKNLYFTTNRSVFRKAKELLTTFRMEKEISKRAILSQYVNIIEWGGGIFGIEKAADHYFGKEPANISIQEASRLAGVIPAPLIFKANENKKYVQHRASLVRERLNNIKLEL